MNFLEMLLSFVQPYKIDSMPLYLPTKKFSKQYCKAMKMSSVLCIDWYNNSLTQSLNVSLVYVQSQSSINVKTIQIINQLIN